ncbi:MAG: 5'/3'-nucleotidase SurE [Pseudomonadota bacterium]
MRILLTNDDGIHADGIKSLEKIARTFSDDIWIVAPETDNSGASHSLTLSDPLRIREVSDRHYAVQGTPTDCVIMALRHIMKDERPDLVLSGVNRGHNIADDVTYSGTVAGAIEGSLLGIRSIALSQAYGFETNRSGIHWSTAEAYGPKVLKTLLDWDVPASTIMNVNLPDCAPDRVIGTRLTRQGKRDQDTLKVDERVDARGRAYFWLGFQKKDQVLVEGTDLWALSEKYISVTPLSVDLTDERAFSQYKSMDFSS